MRIYLLGFMGAGKTYFAQKLADHFSIPHYDLDTLIETEQGKSISKIFEQEGEARFREYESAMLNKTTSYEKAVIATGGGTPCQKNNLSFINKHGVSCYLSVSAKKLWERLQSEKSYRPLVADLDDKSLYDYIKKKLKERLPYYQQAHITHYPEKEEFEKLTQKIESHQVK
jgi:shikimate kinase